MELTNLLKSRESNKEIPNLGCNKDYPAIEKIEEGVYRMRLNQQKDGIIRIITIHTPPRSIDEASYNFFSEEVGD
jgi:hypothetical protein